MLYLLDACALIVFLRGEPGADVVRDILTSDRAEFGPLLPLGLAPITSIR
jgi:hypothetical protein